MSTNENLHERRIAILRGRVEPEYLEGLVTDEPDEIDDVDETRELLEDYGEDLLSDEDAVEAEIQRLEDKIQALSSVLPEDRREEIEAQIETLRAVPEATNQFLSNSPEALAERIHQ